MAPQPSEVLLIQNVTRANGESINPSPRAPRTSPPQDTAARASGPQPPASGAVGPCWFNHCTASKITTPHRTPGAQLSYSYYRNNCHVKMNNLSNKI